MLAQSLRIIPPAPKVHAKDLPGWRLLLEFSRNTVSTLPNYAFDVLISRRRILGFDSLLLNDPDGVRHVLTTAREKYKRLVSTHRVLGGLGSNGLFLATGSQWRRQRRMLAPVFTAANVGVLLPHFAAAAADLANRLNSSSRANLALAFQEATLEAVLRALFSLPESEQRERIAAMVRRYFSGPGRPNMLDGFARTEESFAFATRRRRRFRRAWSDTIDAIIASRRTSPAPAALAICSIFSLPPEIRNPEKRFRMSRFVTNVGRCLSPDRKPPRGSFSGRPISSHSTRPNRIGCAMNSQPIHRSESASLTIFSTGQDHARHCSKRCGSIRL